MTTAGVNISLVLLKIGEQVKRAILVAITANIPIALWGGVGVGKSQIVAQLAKQLGYKLYDVRLSDKEPSDLGGLPVPVLEFWEVDATGKRTGRCERVGFIPKTGNTVETKGRVEYMMAGILPFEIDEKVLLFFDEVDRTDIGVLNALLQIVLDRRINGHRLGDNVRIVMAGNSTTDDGTTTLTLAAKTRTIHIYTKSDLESWMEWAEESEDGKTQNTSALIRAFAKADPEIWKNGAEEYEKKLSDLAIPTNRTWVMADKIIAVAEKIEAESAVKTKDILSALVQGCVGHVAMTKLMAYKKDIFDKVATIEEIVADPEHVAVPTDPSTLNSVRGMIAHHIMVNEKDAPAIATWVARWDGEPKAAAFRKLLAKQPHIALAPAFQKWNKGHLSVSTIEQMDNGAQAVKMADPNNPIVQKAIATMKGELKPDADEWVNRVNITSDSGNKYIVSQNRNDGRWACGCRGWTTRRFCKHLDELGIKEPDSYGWKELQAK